MWDGVVSLVHLLHRSIWWYNVRSGQLTITDVLLNSEPSKDKGTDPSRGVCPLRLIIAHMFAPINAQNAIALNRA